MGMLQADNYAIRSNAPSAKILVVLRSALTRYTKFHNSEDDHQSIIAWEIVRKLEIPDEEQFATTVQTFASLAGAATQCKLSQTACVCPAALLPPVREVESVHTSHACHANCRINGMFKVVYQNM